MQESDAELKYLGGVSINKNEADEIVEDFINRIKICRNLIRSIKRYSDYVDPITATEHILNDSTSHIIYETNEYFGRYQRTVCYCSDRLEYLKEIHKNFKKGCVIHRNTMWNLIKCESYLEHTLKQYKRISKFKRENPKPKNTSSWDYEYWFSMVYGMSPKRYEEYKAIYYK